MDIDESCTLSPGISMNHVHYRLEYVGTIVTWGYHMETIDDHKCEHGMFGRSPQYLDLSRSRNYLDCMHTPVDMLNGV